ncbi:hypothetical protein [Virgibacillus sp. MG-45]|uniref:hypothetical protein n=1 Tax=Virgibacillus sp. MG-45 TaxID=3102791 RepID=UPI002EDA473C
MLKRNVINQTIGFLTGLFVILPILHWAGIPTFENVFFILLGEPNNIKRAFAIIISLLLILLINKIFNADNKKKT